MSITALLPFRPHTMTPAQLAEISFLARYTGQTHKMYTFQLRRWSVWCESNQLDPLAGIQRAHVELFYSTPRGPRADGVFGQHLDACSSRILQVRTH